MQDNEQPKTDDDFAAVIGASPTLVKRIARACASMDMLDELGPGLYAPNDLTRLLSKPEYVGGIIHWYVNTFTRDNERPLIRSIYKASISPSSPFLTCPSTSETPNSRILKMLLTVHFNTQTSVIQPLIGSSTVRTTSRPSMNTYMLFANTVRAGSTCIPCETTL